MLAIMVTLLHGTVRAGSPDDLVLAGHPVGEWPPSPARLFSALVAADGSRDRCRVTTGEELVWLEQQAPPVIYASVEKDVVSSELADRFVPVDETKDGYSQDYPARKNELVRPGVRQCPRVPHVTYVWPDADASPAIRDALARRAARIGYLGCSTSPVQARLVEDLNGIDAPAWVPDTGGTADLPAAYPGFLAALDDAYDRWRAGEPMRRAWIPTRRTRYRSPSHRPKTQARGTTLWLRLDQGLSGRKLVAFTDTLRRAVLDHVQRLVGADEVPAILHGHRRAGSEGPQACFLGLLNVGYERSDGRILGAAVWLPDEAEPTLVQLVRSALSRIAAEGLTRPGWFALNPSLYAGEPRPWAANPQRWQQACRRWMTATPAVHERWGSVDLAEVSRWCAHAGLPKPVAFRLQRYPEFAGALDLHPSQVFRPGRERRPYSHLAVEFADPVRGPVLIGRGRQLGLGLMVPAEAALSGADE